MSSNKESSLYGQLGASSSKEGILNIVKDKGDFFSQVVDGFEGDNNNYYLLHSDGAGTKTIPAYIAYRESGDTSWFVGLAIDSAVMNLDDILAVGLAKSFILNNTIGRNKRLIADECIKSIIEGYNTFASNLKDWGIDIKLCGGETADIGDVVRTVNVDSSIFCKINKEKAFNLNNIQEGYYIVGVSSFGKAKYEHEYNSGISSNGLTLARYALLNGEYYLKYPEIKDSFVPNIVGRYDIFDTPEGSNYNIAKLILSPTRTYAPFLLSVYNDIFDEIVGVIHLTGGGQTKILRFGRGIRYIKDNLFDSPFIFNLIAKEANISQREMYLVFNMGHRLELVVKKEKTVDKLITLANSFGLEARLVGRTEKAVGKNNELIIKDKERDFYYT